MRMIPSTMRATRRSSLEVLEARRLLSGPEGGPEMDFGDAPNSYGTTLAANGARHFATPNLLLGSTVDVEPDGQPDVNALRDDLNGPVDDEDGVIFLTPLTPGAVAQVEITNGAGAGVLNAWLDFDANGLFDPADQVLSNVMLPAASVTIHNFLVPAGSVIGQTYARFRLAGTFDCPPVGPFGFGEVEDYAVKIEGTGEELDFGDAPNSYRTTLAVNGARHAATPNLLLGQVVDVEPDGQPDPMANRDDLNGLPDDEDGVVFLDPIIPGNNVRVQVTTGAGAGRLNAWLDFNINGVFEPGDQIFTNVFLPGASVTVLNFLVPAGATTGDSYARFRLNETGGLMPFGFGGFGEVEDYLVKIEAIGGEMDFGDAPETVGGPFMYPTVFAGVSGDPARHIIAPGAPMLGNTIDPEPDGQPNLLASGDDANGIDDEDGVTIGGMPFETVPLVAGSIMNLEVTNGGGSLGFLNAWFDWNENGKWESATEQVAIGVPIAAGATIVLPLSVPGHLTVNSQIYSRFRLSSTAGISFQGLAPDGEVEDYRNRALPDTVPPSVTSGGIEYETRQAVRLIFSEPLDPATVLPTDLNALNLDDGTTPIANSVILSAGNTVATWIFNTPGTFINDGDYSFTLPAGAVSDVAGNGLAGAFNLSGPSIFFLAGDADRNRTVNLADFNILAANFGLSGKTFSQGNFDYDALGNVNLADFNILASRFGMSVAPMAAGASAAQSPFSQTQIDEDPEQLNELLS